MEVVFLVGGIIPDFGWPRERLGFWEDVRVGRHEVYIEYFYDDEEGDRDGKVCVDVYQGRKLVKTWWVGDVYTSRPVKKVRVVIDEKGIWERLDDIKDALLRHIRKSIQECGDVA